MVSMLSGVKWQVVSDGKWCQMANGISLRVLLNGKWCTIHPRRYLWAYFPSVVLSSLPNQPTVLSKQKVESWVTVRGEHFVGFFHLSTKGKFVGFSSICRQKSTKNFFGSFNDFLAYIHY